MAGKPVSEQMYASLVPNMIFQLTFLPLFGNPATDWALAAARCAAEKVGWARGAM